MSIRTILVPITGTDAGHPAVGGAFRLAAQLGAHVEGLHARRNARDALAYIGGGMTGAMIEELITTTEQESTISTQRARHDFAAACESAGFEQTERGGGPGEPTAHLMIETGAEDELVAMRGRVADLIVVARASKDDDPNLRAILEAALLESGRPLIVVPPEGLRSPAGLGGDRLEWKRRGGARGSARAAVARRRRSGRGDSSRGGPSAGAVGRRSGRLPRAPRHHRHDPRHDGGPAADRRGAAKGRQGDGGRLPGDGRVHPQPLAADDHGQRHRVHAGQCRFARFHDALTAAARRANIDLVASPPSGVR